MKIEFNLPCRQKLPPPAFGTEPASPPQGRAPRIARLVALAHKLDGLVRSGAVRDYAELARLGHVSKARVSQIMMLVHLAPPSRSTFCFSPLTRLSSSRNRPCEQSPASRAGTTNGRVWRG